MAYADASTVDAGEPLDVDPMTTQETQISMDRLEALGLALEEKCDEWVAAKKGSGIEKRWLEDYDQYMGRDEASKQVASMMESAEQGFPVTNRGNRPQRSTVFINITRPKTNTAEARVANMLLPTDDRNFGLKPSPSPELTAAAKMLAKMQTSQAQPAQPGGSPMAQQGATGPQMAQPQGLMGYQQEDPNVTLERAEDASKAMQTEIDDQFQECNWNGECRAMIHDSAVLGTGVIKGPIVVNKTTKSWQPIQAGSRAAYMLEIGSELKPTSYRVSPWNVYPDPSCGNDIHNGSGLFECYSYTSKQVRELAKQPNFIAAQIAKVLEAGPDKFDKNKNAMEARQNDAKKQTYKVWEYWGEFDPEDLRSAGVDVEDSSTGLVSGCVIFINGIVVKGFLNPLDTGDIPYDFYPWEEDEESPWGYGVPYLCRPAQRVLTAAWRQLMDNSGNTVGPQMVIKPSLIQPADGNWQITGNKLWNCLDASVDVRTAFASIDINNHAADLENIIKLAKEFADEESMVPNMNPNEGQGVPDTVGGMVIHQNSINVVLGRKAKSFDDRIITRHVGRYVDWNMAYNEKEEIKGDHHVVARGTSALLVRDIQNQTLIQFGQFQNSGVISPMVNWEAWIKAVLKAQHVDPGEILKTDAEIEKLQSQPPAPPIELQKIQAKGQVDASLQQQKFSLEMQAEEASLQADQQRLQSGELTPHAANATARIQTAQINAEAKLKVEESRAAAEQAYANNEAQMSRDNANARLQELELKRDLALLDYANKHQLSLEQIKADLAKTSMVESTKRQLAEAELQLKANESHKDRQHDLHLNALSNAAETTSEQLANDTKD